jgi:surface protein
MGRLGQNPSSRGYATPTYATTQLTSRETFGGNSKAGLGRHIGMGPFTYSAIVNGSSGHQASFLAGNSFPAAFRAGNLLDIQYPISKTNQLARVGTGTTGGMTRTPADGVNSEQRKEMQERVDKWNKVWPAMPIRDTPNECCKNIPNCECATTSSISVFQTSAQLQQAVNLWFSNETQAIAQYGDISTWDVSLIQDMSSLFSNTALGDTTTGDITSWDTSNVTDMNSMFNAASQFNQPLNNWDVSNVINMNSMFNAASQFNQDISNWDVSNVTNMNSMFNAASGMDNQNWTNSAGYVTWIITLDSILVNHPSNVANFYYNSTTQLGENYLATGQPSDAWPQLYTSGFQFTSKSQLQTAIQDWFNTPVSAQATYGMMASWDVSLITDMSQLFQNNADIKTPNTGYISHWDVSNVKDMSNMFYAANDFNQPLNYWDISNVTNMNLMFYGTHFNQDISSWNTSNVADMGAMFANAPFNYPINTSGNSWNVSNVTNMGSMFLSTPFNQDISQWDTSNVQNMPGMFYRSAFNQDISNWDVSNVTDMNNMFSEATAMNGQDWSSNFGVTNWTTTLDALSASHVADFYYDTTSGSTNYVSGPTPSDAYPILAV